MFISPFRRTWTIIFLLLLLTLITAFWYLTNPKRISALAQVLLSRALGGDVTVGAGHLSFAGTLLLSDVSLDTSGPETIDSTVFHADQLEVRFDWFTLLSGQLRATQVVAFRPTLNLIEDRATGRWNYERLQRQGGQALPVGPSGAPAAPPQLVALPFILLREAKVQWGEVNDGKLLNTASTTVDGELTPDPHVPSIYRLQIDERIGPGGALATETPTSVTGTWDIGSNRFYAATTAINLSELDVRALPRQMRDWWAEHELRGKLKLIRIVVEPETGITISTDLADVSMIQEIPENVTQSHVAKEIQFSDVSGVLQFNVSHGRLQISDLHGHVLGMNFNVDATFEGLSPDAPFDMELTCPNADIGEPYPALMESFAVTHDLVQRLRPRGVADISASIKRTRWNGKVFTNATIMCKDMKIRFCHFPYPLDHVNGAFNFVEDHVEVPNLTAYAGETKVFISGTTGTTPDNMAIDMEIKAPHAMIDERVAWCLPGKVIDTWNLFHPYGWADLECHVFRGNVRAAPTVTVTVEPTDIAATYVGFPYPMKHIKGKIIFNQDETEIVRLAGVPADGSGGMLSYNGVVRHPKGDVGDVHPDVEVFAKDLTINPVLIRALPEVYRRWSDVSGISGWLNVEGKISRDRSGDADFTGDIRIENGAMRPKDVGIGLEHLTAELSLDDELMTLERVDANVIGDPGSTLHASAVLSTANGGMHMEGGVAWEHVTIPEKPIAGLPDAVAAYWTDYGPSGKFSGDVNLVLDLPGEEGAPKASLAANGPGAFFSALQSYSINLYPEGMRLAPHKWPDALEDVNGEIALDAKTIDIGVLTARTGPLALHASGKIDRETRAAQFAIHATGKELPAKWFALLPDNVRSVLDNLKPTGEIDADVPTLERGPETADQPAPPWVFNATLKLANVTTQGQVPLTARTFTVTGKGGFNLAQGTIDFKGGMNAVAVRNSSAQMDTLSADILANPKDKTLTFGNIAGVVAGGRMHGEVNISLAQPPGYKAQLVLSDADVHALLANGKTTGGAAPDASTGRLSASLNVQETFGKDSSRTGRGEIAIRDAKMYDVPLAMGLMQIVTLRLPVSRAFNAADSTYYVRDNKVTFEQILLRSPNVNLAGLGTLALKDMALDLNFITQSPNEWQIPLVTDVVRTVRDELLQVHVGGTVGNPRIEPVPLDIITAPIRGLLPKNGAGAG